MYIALNEAEREREKKKIKKRKGEKKRNYILYQKLFKITR